jgi:hypothetical protein
MAVSLHTIGAIAKHSGMTFCPTMWFFLRYAANVGLVGRSGSRERTTTP